MGMGFLFPSCATLSLFLVVFLLFAWLLNSHRVVIAAISLPISAVASGVEGPCNNLQSDAASANSTEAGCYRSNVEDAKTPGRRLLPVKVGW